MVEGSKESMIGGLIETACGFIHTPTNHCPDSYGPPLSGERAVGVGSAEGAEPWHG